MKIDNNLLLEFKDIMNNKGDLFTFTRIIKNQEYNFINGKLIIKNQEYNFINGKLIIKKKQKKSKLFKIN
jgi:hypothetical protein